MCGIVGLLQKIGSFVPDNLSKMADALRHRGPDGEGDYCFQNIGIAHRRLAIIDLAGGKQPLCNEDGTIWITYNGELYNFQELRKQLESKGHHFKTHSDTEAIVHAYEEWDTDCVSHFRGMFAFAILDQNKRELFLARDHFGIKPLVYLQTRDVFAFASELQALKQIEGVAWDMDCAAIDQYLQFQFIPSPLTAYKQARKLPPAHFMRVGFDGAIKELKRYWQLEFKPDYSKSEAQWLEGLDAVLRDSVNAHLISDVPFGAFLSGGIDSSTVVGYMAQIMEHPVKTFSIGFEEGEFNETKYARQVAAKWKTDHHEEIVKPDALGILPQLVKHYGEPFGDNSAIPTYYVSKLARQHVTMALTGDAGDEMFAGYESYTTRWCRHYSPVPEHLSQAKKIAYRILNKVMAGRFPLRTSTLPDWLRYMQYSNDATRGALWNEDIRRLLPRPNRDAHAHYFSQAASFDHFQKAQFTDFNTYLPDCILAKVDVASMIHSLETRTPLLDVNVVEFAATIPEAFNISKINGHWEGKKLLKKLNEKYYPPDFVYRRKMGFATPIKKWLMDEQKATNEIRDRILSPGTGLDELFKRDSLQQMTEANHAGNLWLLLFLQEWIAQNK
jgi:asparagine synthase (glutamine-hydrolysing)